MLSATTVCVIGVSAGNAYGLSCGSLLQPTCIEEPPPGITLNVPNPHELQPLSGTPNGDTRLYPRVRNHLPYGFNVQGRPLADEVALHEEMGASMARVGVDWSWIQWWPHEQYTVQAWQKPWNYDNLDAAYAAYIAAGIRPVFWIGRTPRRFTKHRSMPDGVPVSGCAAVYACWNPPMSDQTWRLRILAADITRRYPLAGGVEVWNEPNIEQFWGEDPPDAPRYVQMLGNSYLGVRDVNSSWPVLGGALSNHAETEAGSHEAMDSYLTKLLQHNAPAYMDALSYHSYIGPIDPLLTGQQREEEIARRLRQDSETIETVYDQNPQHDVEDERLVITEFGLGEHEGYDETEQSTLLMRQFENWDTGDIFDVPLADRIDAAFAHESADTPEKPGAHLFGFTEFTSPNGYRPKPVYCAFRQTYGGLSGCPPFVTATP